MDQRSQTISLGGREWIINRARLGGFIRLQQAREDLYKGADEADNGLITNALYDFLRVALPDLKITDFHSAPWFEVFGVYLTIERINTIPDQVEYAILRFAQASKRGVPWDNPMRSTILWVHIIARAYGWSKEQIENLWPEEAVALVQEIMVDDQYEKEFFHSLSQVSYQYNKATKKSNYVPLKRPLWMTARRKKDIITLMRRDLLPVGKIEYPPGVSGELKVH
jgi:hypothetical protein